MKEYRRNRACTKCGCTTEAESRFVPLSYMCGIKYPERIDRVCSRCGYTWKETPLDNKEVELKEIRS